MNPFNDTYLSCADKGTLQTFVGNFINHTPIKQGGQEEVMTDDNGEEVRLSGAGDPGLYYACVRSTDDITKLLPVSVKAVDAETGSSIVGVFA